MTTTSAVEIERRSANRLQTPSCPYCGSDHSVVAVIRTKSFVFFRCTRCRNRELLPKVIPSVRVRRDRLLFG